MAPSELGPRRAALEERRRGRRRRAALVAAGIVAASTLGGAGLLALAGDDGAGGGEDPRLAAGLPASDPVTATLVFGTREQSREVVWLTLVTHNDDTDQAAVIGIPAHTAVEIPGRGLHALGDAYTSGGVPLLLVTIENLLSPLDIDRHLELSEQDAQVLLEATGPISVDVPSEVRVAGPDRTTRVIFGTGPQRLPASFVVRLLYTVGLDGDDVELASRHIAFWQGFLEAFREDPEAFRKAFAKAGAALVESDAAPGAHARMLERVAATPVEDLGLDILPVEQVSVGGDELYATDHKETASFLEQLIGSDLGSGDEVRVQVLNGNGVPGIGQEVADRLVGKGFRVLVSQNARRFNYPKTLIVTYDDTATSEAAARRARKLLGVGEIQVSTQSQGIVDLTIVVGKDFVRAR